ncbi:NEP1-interacting protein 1 [Phoenix dactylifera]|uniref:NEP1-interacting protein 1 n=1 Tax=Phoenix dactylifera TaxID=42345 RepID=A0A8B7D2A0_PHODC|nr:NEP1-interacting protein 1 [Phoenix dactylifera]
MDFSDATSYPFSSSSSTLSGNRGGRGRDRWCSVGSRIAGRLFCGMVTCIFAIVGLFVGAVTGGLIGLATESGVFRGIGVGAISGALFSMEVVEKSVTLWRSNESGILSILYVIDIICSLLSGRLVRDKVNPAVQSAVQSQMSAVSSPFREALDIFETGGVKGMEKASVDRLPKIKITMEDNVDASGERIVCAVCLQDFQTGETARSLPHCRHIFHLPCIDSWLIKHGSCPLCRRDF